MSDSLSQLPQSQAAFARLERALRRLEDVAGTGVGTSALMSELQAARDDYARLDDATRRVDGRLGVVIDRLKTLLEE